MDRVSTIDGILMLSEKDFGNGREGISFRTMGETDLGKSIGSMGWGVVQLWADTTQFRDTLYPS